MGAQERPDARDWGKGASLSELNALLQVRGLYGRRDWKAHLRVAWSMGFNRFGPVDEQTLQHMRNRKLGGEKLLRSVTNAMLDEVEYERRLMRGA